VSLRRNAPAAGLALLAAAVRLPGVWHNALSQDEVASARILQEPTFLGAVHLLDEDACAIGYRDIVAGRWRFEWGPRAWRAPIISAAGGCS